MEINERPRKITGEIKFTIATLNDKTGFYDPVASKDMVIKLTLKYLDKMLKYYDYATIKYDDTEFVLRDRRNRKKNG